MKKFVFLLILFFSGIILLQVQDSNSVRVKSIDTGKVLTSVSNINLPSHAPKYSSYPSRHIIYVYICTNKDAYTYHRYNNCQKLDSCSIAIIRIPLSEAKAKGFQPCKICYKNGVAVKK